MCAFRFGNYIGGLPKDQLDKLLDLLYHPTKGLGLNIARYNIGGGRNATNSPQFNYPSQRYWNAVPGFRPSAEGPYDWSADASQRACLLGAKARGADTFMAVAFAPPWWMTVSGDVAGSVDGATNLRSDAFTAFADYLTEVTLQYASDPAWNVTFEVLEPVNEPNDGAWRARRGAASRLRTWGGSCPW